MVSSLEESWNTIAFKIALFAVGSSATVRSSSKCDLKSRHGRIDYNSLLNGQPRICNSYSSCLPCNYRTLGHTGTLQEGQQRGRCSKS